MKARYAPRAVTDLGEIADFIRQFNPAVIAERCFASTPANVRAEIQRMVETLERFPYSGPRTRLEEVRRIVVRRYPYIIYYIVDAARREVVILTIRHGVRVQPFEDE